MFQFKKYSSLTKPGVLFGNVITTAAGFLLAARGQIDFLLLLYLFCGTTLIIASACVTNNILDKDIDQIMARTKKRAMAAGTIPTRKAAILAIALGLIGLLILVVHTNLLVVGIGIAGWVVYVWLYGMLSKRLSAYGTLVGAVSGAAPILAGYVAVTNRIDLGAILVFIILLAWQIPEFYSIAIYRHDEYQAAHIPVVPVVKGIHRAKVEIFIYAFIFVAATALLTVFGYAGYTFGIIMVAFGLYWLWHAYQAFSHKDTVKDSDKWARQMFKLSLIMLLLISGLMAINSFLP
jgi:protoheme IX farnesyltransferase